MSNFCWLMEEQWNNRCLLSIRRGVIVQGPVWCVWHSTFQSLFWGFCGVIGQWDRKENWKEEVLNDMQKRVKGLEPLSSQGMGFCHWAAHWNKSMQALQWNKNVHKRKHSLIHSNIFHRFILYFFVLYLTAVHFLFPLSLSVFLPLYPLSRSFLPFCILFRFLFALSVSTCLMSVWWNPTSLMLVISQSHQSSLSTHCSASWQDTEPQKWVSVTLCRYALNSQRTRESTLYFPLLRL